MAASVRILFVDCAGQHLDGSHEQSTVFFRGALQIEHELLEFFRHDVKRIRQLADFSAALQMYALREIAAGDGTARFGKHFQRIRNTARREDT